MNLPDSRIAKIFRKIYSVLFLKKASLFLKKMLFENVQ